jgi:hypothetical protein
MRINELLMESLDSNQVKKIIRKFTAFAKNELGISEQPKIKLYSTLQYSNQHQSFGGYGNKVIHLAITNRHINDILRSLAHELVHFKQDINNELTNISGETGSEHENNANAQAGIIMRKWGKLNPELFSRGILSDNDA